MSLQVPPFWHWTDAHLDGAWVVAGVGYWVGLINCVWHLEPVKPGLQTQMTRGAVGISVQVPPFIHEIVEHLSGTTGAHWVVVWGTVWYVVWVVTWGVVKVPSHSLPVKVGGQLLLKKLDYYSIF